MVIQISEIIKIIGFGLTFILLVFFITNNKYSLKMSKKTRIIAVSLIIFVSIIVANYVKVNFADNKEYIKTEMKHTDTVFEARIKAPKETTETFEYKKDFKKLKKEIEEEQKETHKLIQQGNKQ